MWHYRYTVNKLKFTSYVFYKWPMLHKRPPLSVCVCVRARACLSMCEGSAVFSFCVSEGRVAMVSYTVCREQTCVQKASGGVSGGQWRKDGLMLEKEMDS